MPGYYAHLATVNPVVSKNRCFIYGVEMPDLLKKYYKLGGLIYAEEKYNLLHIKDMPFFSFFEERVQQDADDKDSTNGLHYGWSSSPDIYLFWNSLSSNQKNNSFFIGYLWHLLGDKLVYSWLDIEGKFNSFLKQHKNDPNLSTLMEIEYKKLHNDWDKLNALIRDRYPDVILTPEVIELNTVKYNSDSHLDYVDWNILKNIIDYMRSINPLEEDSEKIINEIKLLLPQNNNLGIDNLCKMKILSKKLSFENNQYKKI